MSTKFYFKKINRDRKFFESSKSKSTTKSNTFRRFNNIFVTIVEKTIYEHFIDFDLSEDTNMFEQSFSFDVYTQRLLNVVVNRIVKIYILRNSSQQNSFDSSNSQNFQNFQNENDDYVDNDNNSRWNVVDFELFGFMYDDKSMHIDDFIVQIDKNTYFKNVHQFIRQANDIIKIKKIEIIRQNLWMNLKNIVLKWWISELIDNEQFMIIFIVDVNDRLNQWTRFFHVRFKTSSNIIFDALFNERYTLRDAINRREFRKYVQKIFRLIKDVNLNNVKNQLNFIYNDIDNSFRKEDIKRSKKNDDQWHIEEFERL